MKSIFIKLSILLLVSICHAEWIQIPTEFTGIGDFEVWEDKPGVIYIANASGASYSMDDGTSWSTPVKPDDDEFIGFTVNPFDLRHVIMQYNWNLFISQDYGQNWERVPGLPFSPRSRYVAFSPYVENQLFTTAPEGLFNSPDGGFTWERIFEGYVQGYNHAVAQSAQNPDIILVNSDYNTVHKTTDGGETWQPTGFAPARDARRAVFIDATNADNMYIISYPNVYNSQDGGASWQTVGRIDNIPLATQLYAFDFYPYDPKIIVTATNKGVFISLDAGRQWQELDAGIDYISRWQRKTTFIRIIRENNRPVVYANIKNRLYRDKDIFAQIVSNTKDLYFNNYNNTIITQELQITNAGCDTLFIETAMIDNSAFELLTAIDSILPKSSVIVQISFNPAGTVDIVQGNLLIKSNAADNPDLTIKLTGINYQYAATAMQLTNDPGTDQNPFLLKGRRDGNVYLFWESDRGENLGIYWKKCVNGDWSETMTVISDSLRHERPKAAMDSKGNLWLCYVTNKYPYSYDSDLTVLKYDNGGWSKELSLDEWAGKDRVYYNEIAVDGNDNIYVYVSHEYFYMLIKYDNIEKSWGQVEYTSNAPGLGDLHLILPSTTHLPWLIYFYRYDQHGGDYCHTYADYLTESGEWQQIHINWPAYWMHTDEDDAKFYAAVADSMGHIYMGHSNQLDWSMEIDTRYKHYIVRQFDCATAEETGSWVLNAIERPEIRPNYYNSISGPWGYMKLCADKSFVGYTIYNTEEKQMYTRKFDGINWTIAQPVPGFDEKFMPRYPNYHTYTTLIDGDELMVCATVKINDDTELFMSTIEFNTLIDTTIKQLEYYAQLDTATTGVENDYDNGDGATPQEYALQQNYPNPFNPSTTITYALPKPGRVNISIYNMLGQRVATLVDGYQADLNGSVQWHGLDDDGQRVSSGIYFARMNAGDYTKTIKMALVE